MFEQKLTFKGKTVYTSKRVEKFCEIDQPTLSKYSITENPLLIREEDYCILDGKGFLEFEKENPTYNYLSEYKSRRPLRLFYESALEKILEYKLDKDEQEGEKEETTEVQSEEISIESEFSYKGKKGYPCAYVSKMLGIPQNYLISIAYRLELIRGEDYIVLKGANDFNEFKSENSLKSLLGIYQSVITGAFYYLSGIEKLKNYKYFSRERKNNSVELTEEKIQKEDIEDVLIRTTEIEESKEPAIQEKSLESNNNNSSEISNLKLQLELVTRLVIRLDEENKELRQKLNKIESQNSQLELIISEYINLRKVA